MKNTSGKLWVLGKSAEKINWDLAFESELPRVYNFFLYKTGDRESAQDLTATTFERAGGTGRDIKCKWLRCQHGFLVSPEMY